MKRVLGFVGLVGLALFATAGAAGAASTGNAVLSTDHVGKAGAITLRAGGFKPNSSVQLRDGSAVSRFQDAFGTPLTADANGNVVATVGQGAFGGMHRVRLTGVTPTGDFRTTSAVYTAAPNETNCPPQCLAATGGTTRFGLIVAAIVIALVGRRALRGHGAQAVGVATGVVLVGATLAFGLRTESADAAIAPATLAGVVHGVGGHGLAGVCVHASSKSGFASAVTDNHGHYALLGLKPGTYQLNAADCNPMTMLIGRSLGNVAVVAGSSNRNFAMTTGGVLFGRVHDAAGAPVAAECIRVAGGASFSRSCFVGTDVNGYYLSEPLRAGRYGVAFQDLSGKFGLQYLGGVTSPKHARLANVTAGRMAAADVTAQEAGSIGGKVDNKASGKALAGICVLVYSNDAPTMMSATTQQSGSYSIAVSPGTYKVKFADRCDNQSVDYADQFYNEKTSLATADSVAVADGATVTGIDGHLTQQAPEATTTTTTSTTVVTNPATSTTSTTVAPATTTSTTAAPQAAPTKQTPTGTANTSSTNVAPGGIMTVNGSGFQPGSTVEADLFSTPKRLAVKAATSTGTVSFTVTIPSDTDPGQHDIQLQGVDPSGRPRILSRTITVGLLSRTGSSVTNVWPLGVALVLLGGVGIFLGRRRMLGAHFVR